MVKTGSVTLRFIGNQFYRPNELIDRTPPGFLAATVVPACEIESIRASIENSPFTHYISVDVTPDIPGLKEAHAVVTFRWSPDKQNGITPDLARKFVTNLLAMVHA